MATQRVADNCSNDSGSEGAVTAVNYARPTRRRYQPVLHVGSSHLFERHPGPASEVDL